MKLFYKKFGEGKPLIILHGLFGSLDNWQTIGKQFAEKGFEVYLVDQRNHGHSPHSEEWNYEVMADDLMELVSELNLTKVSIIGHSMGGKTAMCFANKFSDRVKNLIVVDISPRYYPIHHHSVIKALKAVSLEKISSRKEAEEILKEYLPGDMGTQQFLLKNLYWKDGEEKKLAWRFNLNVISKNIENVGVEVCTNNISLPTLFIRGEQSEYINNADVESIKKIFPHVEVETISGSGHWVHAEKPQEFLSCALGFLS